MEYYRHKGSKNIFIKIDNTGYDCSDYYKKETGDIVNIRNIDMEEVTFQEAFSDEIESIVRQYKDALAQSKDTNLLQLEENKRLWKENSEAHEANNKLKAEIENLKIERDQLVIDYNELENRKFDSEIDDTMTNDEYALKSKVESLTKANDKLADLAIKFYLKSEGIKL